MSVTPVCGIPSDTRTFDLSSDGNVAIAAPALTRVARCDPVPFVETLATTDGDVPSPVGLLQLAAGRYYLDFSTAVPHDLAVLAPSQPWAGSDTASLQAFAVPEDQPVTLAVALPRRNTPWNIKLRFEKAHALTVSRTSSSLPVLRLLACPGADATSLLCQHLDLADGPVSVCSRAITCCTPIRCRRITRAASRSSGSEDGLGELPSALLGQPVALQELR